MHISSTYTARSRHRGTTLLLLWAFTLQWILPLDIMAKQLASLSPGKVIGAPAISENLATEPLPEIQTEFVRQIPLIANDVVYSSSTGKLYASVPSSAGSSGNSIATIDPSTGAITNSVFIGSEPNKLALSDDGHTLYVSLDGAFAVRRFDTLTQTPGAQFALGRESFFGVYSLNDLAVAPGNPNLVAVARAYRGTSPPEAGVAVFENGVRRTQTGPGHIEGSDFLAFSASASKLYGTGFYSGLKTLTIDSNGVTVATSSSLSSGYRIKFDNGRIYSNSGQVINPDSSTLLGTFSAGTTSAFVPDSAVGRAYFLVPEQFSGSSKTLKAFDINTFVPVGAATLSGISGDPTTLIRWGSNGLAFRTTNNQLFIVQTSLIPSADPIPTPTVAPSPTPTPSPAYVPTFIRRVELPANDMVFNQATGSLYASVPSIAGANGNSITRIAPDTGVIGSSVFIGSEPGKLALSDDGQTLYTSLNGANAIRRFDIPTETPGPQFSSSPQPVDMDVLPGNPNSIAISKGTGSFGSPVRIYDNGVARPNAGTGSFYSVGPIEFGSSAATLYGYDHYSSGFELVKFAVNASGLTTVSVANSVIVGFSTGLKYSNGLLYSSSGRVVDPELQQVVGTFPSTGFGNALAVDAANGRAYYISNNDTPVLRAYDINTFLPLGSVTLNGVIGTPVNLMRWGNNGLAFSTIGGFSDPASSRVYLLQTALVSASAPIPTGIQFSTDKYNTFEGSSNVSLIVTRSGDVSAATSVNYATSDGTATAGSDYTAANGTINFNAGETSKTISISLLDDNVYEGPAETFNVTLTNPSGTAVLVSPSTAVVTISDSESKPVVGVTSNGVTEGNSGTTGLNFTVTLSNRSYQTVTVDYTTTNNSATAGSDYISQSGTVSFEPGSTSKLISVLVSGDTVDEPDETFFVNLSNAPNANFISPSQATGTIFNDDGPPRFFFATSSTQVSEGVGQATISVIRAGRNTSTASVNFTTQDGSARQTSDYTVATGTLVFSPGQVSRSIRILINDDAYVEGTETVQLALSNPIGDGAILGTPNLATLFIQNNDFGGVSTNPIDDAAFFVRAHYSDFLGRVPDDEGFAYWTAQITNCGSDATCIHDRRVGVSNAFFFEQEYQQTASYVFLLYRAAYGDNQPIPNPDANLNEAKKLPRYLTFVRDRAQVVGGSNLAQSQLTLANAFVQRPEFVAKYPASLSTGEAFVDAVLATIQSADGAVLTNLDRDTLVAHFNNGGRGLVMFHLANDYWNGCERLPGSPAAPCVPAGFGTPVSNQPFIDAEYTRSFVYSQYSGYLRRDADIGGFLFWLNEVNKAAPRNVFVQRAMVCSFITSAEYQERFSPVVTHTNADCP